MAGPAQCAQAVAEQDCPEPLHDRLAGVARGDERGEVHGPAVDGCLGPGVSCPVVEGFEKLVAGDTVAVTDAQAGEVDQWLEGELRGGLAAGACRGEDVELAPAQVAGEAGHCAVAGDERCKVGCLGRVQQGVAGSAACLVGELGNTVDALGEGAAGGSRARHERELPGGQVAVVLSRARYGGGGHGSVTRRW